MSRRCRTDLWDDLFETLRWLFSVVHPAWCIPVAVVEAGFGFVYNAGLDAESAIAVCNRSGAAKMPALQQRHGAATRQDGPARWPGVLGLLDVREDEMLWHQGSRVNQATLVERPQVMGCYGQPRIQI